MTTVMLLAGILTAAADTATDLAKQILPSNDERLYCHAEGRWSENAIRCLVTQGANVQFQRCEAAKADVLGATVKITPARWRDAEIAQGQICKQN
jgi:hypothetical protein